MKLNNIKLNKDLIKIINILNIKKYDVIDSYIFKITHNNIDFYIIAVNIDKYRIEVYKTIQNCRECVERGYFYNKNIIIDKVCLYFKKYKRIYKLKQLND
jgi:hypothetical protein